jgi:organic radical activating enzyme
MILRHRCPRVVITGGEPLLQETELLETIRHILHEMPDCLFEVETNGTRIPHPDFEAAIHQFNVSPKLANACMPESLRLHPAALEFFAASPKSWFKFVVARPADLVEIQSLRSRFSISPDRILLMPEGRTAADLDRTGPQLAATCRDLGFRFSDRLHIRLWGDRRGV